jgi:hypothetical protein
MMRWRPFRGPRRRFRDATRDQVDQPAQSTSYAWTPSGGLVFDGAAAVSFAKVFPPSGGLSFGGSAIVSKAVAPTVSGGLALGGSAPVRFGRVYPPAGGVAFAGSAPVSARKVFAPSGGIILGGAAVTGFVDFGSVVFYTWAPSGGLAFGGEGAYAFTSAPYTAPAGRKPRGRPAWVTPQGYLWTYEKPPAPKSYAYVGAVALRPFGGAAVTSWKIQPVDYLPATSGARVRMSGAAHAVFHSMARRRREEREMIFRWW